MSADNANITEFLRAVPKGVKIVAASKTRSAAEINALILYGITDFGENRVQEYLSKRGGLSNELTFHFIGRLQTNKVKYIIEDVALIQSLDRPALLAEIDKRAEAAGKVCDCLIEINAGEEQKGGVPVAEAVDFYRLCLQHKNVRIRGLMCVLPEGAAKEMYLQIRALYDKIKETAGAEFDTLSMGMSEDYLLAVECGANMIRPGRILFGARYK